jgi:hypothetical protein
MPTDLTGYRFQDTSEDAYEAADQAVVYSVEFYPSIEDYVHVAKIQNEKHAALTSWSKFTFQAFFVVNTILPPVVLAIFQYPIAAFIWFLLDVILAAVFLPAIVKADYRRFYRSVYGEEFENQLVKVELTHDGIFCRHLYDFSFHDWKSVTGIEETDEAIFVNLKTSSLPVRKSGFPYIERQNEFTAFARSRQAEARNELTQ